jgi:sec-independent protein translocase protein TatC
VRLLLPKRLASDEAAELVDHLGELRTRLFVCVGALAVGGAIGYAVHGRLIEALEQALPPERRRLVTYGVVEPFATSFRISLLVGFLLVLPIILWQVWSFLAPAFEESVTKAISSMVGLAGILAGGGVVFGYAVALPAAVGFLTTYDQTLYDIQIRASDYVSFASLVLFACAIVFELPLFVVALVRLRILDSGKLRRNRRTGYVAVAALAVALPGVDPVTTASEMVPLVILFEAAIWASVLVDRRQAAAGGA